MAKLIRRGIPVYLLRVLFLAFVLFLAGPGWMQMVHAQSLPPDFPTTPIRDAFNRANGSIGTAWNGNKTGFAINANRLDVGTGGYLLWRTPSFGATQEVHVTLSAIDPAAGEIALLLKSQGNSTWNKGVIKVIYHPDIQRVQVFTYTSTGGWVQQGADIDQAFANGDRFGAKATVSGQVVIYRNTTQVAAVDIRSWSLYTKGGYIGLWFTNASNMLVDDFGGGTWVQPTPTRTSTSTPTITQTSSSTPTLTQTSAPSLTPSPLPSDTPTPVPSATPLPSDTPTPVLTFTPEPSATPTPLPTATSEPLVTPTSTNQSPATTGHFAIGPGGSDVIPHQVVRTNDDRVFVFAYRGDLSNQLMAYWTSQVGFPTEAAQFTAATPYTQPAVIISVETVYDGLNTIHVLFNSTDGT
ncbi:MAG: hypothetical protein HY835_13125, partial [Anaerolineae bacterium]|nr:hypothetical protein [Anaerolineae bacterium]